MMKKNLLFYDKDKFTRTLLHDYLQFLDMTYDIPEDEASFVTLLEEYEYDLIFIEHFSKNENLYNKHRDKLLDRSKRLVIMSPRSLHEQEISEFNLQHINVLKKPILVNDVLTKMSFFME
jgi:DNA-binding response OmpR family regulator